MAGSARDIKAGRAFVEITAFTNGLEKGLRAASAKLKAFGEGMTSIGKKAMLVGVGIVTPLLAAAKFAADSGSALWDMSKRTGISVEALSALGFAAEMTGTSMESVEVGVKRMQKTLAEAAGGSKSANADLAALGLTVEQLQGLAPEEQFRLLAQAITKIQDPAQRTASAMAIFGKSGTDLLPMMGEFDDLVKTARERGLIRSTEFAKSADEFGDALTILVDSLKVLRDTVGSALFPILTQFATKTTDLIVAVSRWVGENKGLVVILLGVGVALTIAGAALFSFGKVVIFTASVFKGLSVLIGALGPAITLLANPWVLVGLAIAGVVTYLAYVSGYAGKAINYLSGVFSTLKDDALIAFKGIGDAIAAGDIALAAQILWTTLKLEWQRGIAFLTSYWEGFKAGMVKIAAGAFYGVISAFWIVNDALQVAWIELTAFMQSTWANFASGFQSSWETAINWTTQRLLELQGLFDKTLDVADAQQRAQQVSNQKQADIQQKKNADLAEIEANRSGKRVEQDKLLQDRLNRVGEAYNNLAEGADKNAADAVAQSQAELDALKAKRDALVAEAAAKAAAAKTPEAPTAPQAPSFNARAASDSLSSKGVFSGWMVRSLGGSSSAANRTAKATEKTADGVGKLIDLAQAGELRFA